MELLKEFEMPYCEESNESLWFCSKLHKCSFKKKKNLKHVFLTFKASHFKSVGDRWVIVGRDDLNSQFLTRVVTISHLRMEVYFRHLPRAPLPWQQRASPRQGEIQSVWSSEGAWGAAAAAANVSSFRTRGDHREMLLGFFFFKNALFKIVAVNCINENWPSPSLYCIDIISN